MTTLRVRFSGLCLFHKENGKVVVRVVQAPGHKPQLWLDTATGSNESQERIADGVSKECALMQDSRGNLTADWRTVEKYSLLGEEISFGNGEPPGPTDLPGVAPLSKVHPSLRGVNRAKGVGAIITLNRGRFRLGPTRAVDWNDKDASGTEPTHLPLWTDLLIETTDAAFRVDSSAGSWELVPSNTQIDIWIFADGTGSSSEHFKHLYDFCHNATKKPWPQLKPPPLPKCGVIGTKKIGSTFCPDGEHP